MKINWNYIKIIFIAALTVFVLAFSSKRNNTKNLTGKELIFLDDAPQIITLEAVNKLLIQNDSSVTSMPKETLVLDEMESFLTKNPMIANAEVFVTVDGILKAKIKQRRPIARVVASTHFYLDEEGKHMPLSEIYAVKVPLVTGNATENFQELKEILLKIENDPFMHQQIVGIHIESKNNFFLHVREHDFKIDFGQAKNITRKFQNFKAFYQKTVKDSTITGYNLVNLKLDSQVVATKK